MRNSQNAFAVTTPAHPLTRGSSAYSKIERMLLSNEEHTPKVNAVWLVPQGRREIGRLEFSQLCYFPHGMNLIAESRRWQQDLNHRTVRWCREFKDYPGIEWRDVLEYAPNGRIFESEPKKPKGA